MKRSRAAAILAISLLTVAWTAGSTQAEAAATPSWAPADQASIHPGVQTRTESGQCTSNFVFYDSTDIYIGQAAHCSSTGPITDVNGCEAGILPLGTPVQIEGASRPAQIVYNSWVVMQQHVEKNESVCAGNDFALVRLDPSDRGRVNPSIPFWGGPNGLDPTADGGESVYGYANSQLRLGIDALSPQYGFSMGDFRDGWSHEVRVLTPGISGDSGSAFLGSDGGALGVLSTITVDLANQVSDLSRALEYMRVHTDFDAVKLANGTEPFSPLF